MLPDVL